MSETELDKLVTKMNTNSSFAEDIFTDFDFASKEFSKAGVQLNRADYDKFINARKAFLDAARPLFTPAAASGTTVTGTVGVTRSF